MYLCYNITFCLQPQEIIYMPQLTKMCSKKKKKIKSDYTKLYTECKEQMFYIF